MKKRLDVLLVERQLARSREQAQGLIMAGVVKVGGRRCDKAGTPTDEAADIVVERPLHPYVSRGGLKLEKALDAWDVPISGIVAMDVGASTGGFTHLLLLRGATRVYAVDVGYGQLDTILRDDPRVVNLERINARYLSSEQIPEPIDVATIDVAFISLSLILPPVAKLLRPQGGQVIALIKPQFEAGRKQVGNGVVRDPAIHREVILKVAGYAEAAGMSVQAVEMSPVKGPAGNVEFLAWIKQEPPLSGEQLEALARQAVGDS